MANTYRCPGCGASLEYTPGTDALVCAYCGTEVSVEQLSRNEAGENRTENHSASDMEDTQARQSFHGYTCQSCGAQLITEE